MNIEQIANEFIEKCENYFSLEEMQTIKKAYAYATECHKGKIRLNKEDYMTHPIAVAEILIDMNVDATTLIAAILHETINHGGSSKEEIEKNFGSEVASIVQTISKLNRLELNDDSSQTALNFRKVVVGMSEDVRVLFLKLADRLQNLRTGKFLDKDALKRKVLETQVVLIPIAHRLCMYKIKGELENLCLKYSKPDVYNDILERLNATEEELMLNLQEMQDSISDLMVEQNISFKIKSRVKSVYSIYNKLNHGKKWEQIYDILAMRVIVEKVSECYLAIGLIHAKYRPIPGRFKDYIAMPKKNMYQSLHTGVFGSDGNRYEIQIRTKDMDDYAEKGMAAHFAYKENLSNMKNLMDEKLEIFRNLIESSESLSDIEFQNAFTAEFTEESIYVYTPKGDVLELPNGSTPIDFAYRIHTDVGDKTVGAIVNDAIVPLSCELQNNDIVSIKTNNTGTPNKEWLNFVKTSHARNKIKSFFSKQEKENYIEKGKNIFQTELRKKHLSFDSVTTEENLKKIFSNLKLESLEDLYFSIGSLRFTVSTILNILEDKKEETAIDKLLNNKNHKKAQNYKSDILVNDKTGILVNLAECCHPVLGDNIVGYITKGEGVTVHKSTCANVQIKNDRFVNVSWNKEENPNGTYYSLVVVTCEKGKNYLLDIINKSSGKNVYIDSVKTKEKEELTSYELLVKTSDLKSLENFMTSLYQYKFVKQVERK